MQCNAKNCGKVEEEENVCISKEPCELTKSNDKKNDFFIALTLDWNSEMQAFVNRKIELTQMEIKRPKQVRKEPDCTSDKPEDNLVQKKLVCAAQLLLRNKDQTMQCLQAANAKLIRALGLGHQSCSRGTVGYW